MAHGIGKRLVRVRWAVAATFCGAWLSVAAPAFADMCFGGGGPGRIPPAPEVDASDSPTFSADAATATDAKSGDLAARRRDAERDSRYGSLALAASLAGMWWYGRRSKDADRPRRG